MNFKKKFCILLYSAIGITAAILMAANCFSQMPPSGNDISIKDADAALNYGNLKNALNMYLTLLKNDSLNTDLNYKIGFCYTNMNDDKAKAIPYLEYVTGQPKIQPVAWFYLGKAYQFSLRFDDAIAAFEKYKSKADKASMDIADRQIETCRNGKTLVKRPVKIKFENLGKEINSPYPDYNPLVPDDESFMLFSSRRKGNVGNFIDEYAMYSSDIYIAAVKSGKFTKAKNMGGGINTEMDEESLGITPDGNNLLIFVDDIDIYSDIYMTSRKGKSFQRPVPLPAPLNSNDVEEGGSLTISGDTIYFTSNRSGGYGGTDIYRAIRLPSGKWSLPVNIGPIINTRYNESSPLIMPDGLTFFFSSEGHNSIGGFDLFYSIYNYDDSLWAKPKNLGYPINTPDDNKTICFAGKSGFDQVTKTKRYAYISAYRKDGMGDLDIYRITFEETEPQYTTITGQILVNIPAEVPVQKGKPAIVTSSSKDKIEIIANAVITVTDKITGEDFGTYIPNPTTGKYVMILLPSTYIIEIESAGYKTLHEEMTILEKGSFKSEIEKNFILEPAK